MMWFSDCLMDKEDLYTNGHGFSCSSGKLDDIQFEKNSIKVPLYDFLQGLLLFSGGGN